MAIGGFLLNLLFTTSSNPKKEEAKEDLNKRKQQYKEASKTVVIDDVAKHLDASFNWDDYAAVTVQS